MTTTFTKINGGYKVEERVNGKLRGLHWIEERFVKKDENGELYIDTEAIEKEWFS